MVRICNLKLKDYFSLGNLSIYFKSQSIPLKLDGEKHPHVSITPNEL